MTSNSQPSDRLGLRLVDRRTLLFGAGVIGLAACAGSDEGAAPITAGEQNTTTASPGTTVAGGGDTTVSEAETSTANEAVTSVAEPASADGVTPLGAADFDALAVCALLPSTTAGPFPTIEQLDRRDVTEGYPGHPMRLGLRVVDEACDPIAGAQVEIWHTDATGDYSSYEDGGGGKDEGSGTTFMRGFQTSDADGIVEFSTIFPGWYSGRVAHVHVRVNIDDNPVLTTQLYFDDAYTDQIYSTEPYAEFGPQDTTLATDRLVGDPQVDGSGIALRSADTERGPGTLGLANIGVSR